MSEAREPLNRVCVAGGGQVGVLAAIAVKRALPTCEVMVLGLPPDPVDFADHAASALPFTNKLHDRLGISEQAIIARAGGSHRLITRYIGWGGQGHYGALSYGAGGEADAAAFAREWGGGSRGNSGVRPAGSLAEALADAGRFRAPPPGEQTPLAEIDYALRWSPSAYHAQLIGEAQRLGVTHIEGTLARIEPDGVGGIAALNLAGNTTIAADLFIDCSGAQAHLLSALPDHRAQDWSDVLPQRRLLFAPPGEPLLALEDRIALLPEGWLLECAGRGGLQTVLCTAPDIGEDALLRALGTAPVYDARLAAGRAQAAWIGNVVALGDAATRFEPLGFLHLDLAHRMLALLLEILPGQSIEPLERAEFNRRAGLMMDGVRDTLAVHYAAPRATQVFGSTVQPEGVTRSIDQFTRRGRLPFCEEHPLLGQERMSLLRALGFAQGVRPQDRTSGFRNAEAARKAFEAKTSAALADTAPYGEWMTAQLQPRR
ncbi:tryptophan 7-halogenase [Qipengyuania marisflavi]|uniref:Tryptophan 7-halogenase n=1 Tax=Qipengyuania marisflavi TaxID=2486356 RepID=A0A5S3P0B4_9SPHN|nr:tryptophan 7-halogenase [Qipengyuania marisflavi]TMM45167.1 tryptophan 7-halogenase [Qipengyuania marisflavi]